jgi:hypothetical protein
MQVGQATSCAGIALPSIDLFVLGFLFSLFLGERSEFRLTLSEFHEVRANLRGNWGNHECHGLLPQKVERY